MKTIFDGIITSKMRIRILMRLFLNPDQQTYLRELAKEFKVSTSQVSGELQQLTDSGLLTHVKKGRQINYQANVEHVLFPELHSMVKKALGMDHIIESIIERLGNLKLAYLIDDYAEGKDTGLIDLVLIGNIDYMILEELVKKAEKYINRKIRTLVFTDAESDKMDSIIREKTKLLLWNSED